MDINEETFLRNLSHSHKQKLSQILDINCAWESFAARVPTKPDLLFFPNEEWVPWYDTTHIHTFKTMKGSPTKNLLDDWGTKNVRLKHLVQVLLLSNLGHAVSIINKDILRKPDKELPRLPHNVTDMQFTSQSGKCQISAESKNYNNNNNLSVGTASKEVTEANKDDLIIAELNDLPSIDSDLSDRLSKSVEACIVRAGDQSNAVASPVQEQMSRLRLDQSENALQEVGELQIIHRGKDVNSGLGFDSPDQPLSVCPNSKVTQQVDRGWASAKEKYDANSCHDLVQPQLEVESPSSSHHVSNQNSFKPDVSAENQILLSCMKGLKEIPFNVLRAITDNFNTDEESKGGRLVGEGGFGYVFLGKINNAHRVAVKCLKDNTEDTVKQFLSEIKTLSNYRHDNLVHLIGYSLDGSQRCLVYEYMVNGSLEDRLACKDDTLPLTCSQRLLIVEGTAKGIEFLHDNKLVHRDIKSANILLDDNLTPKVGDFATARATSSDMTTKIIGTQVYLAPEALSGQIHIGLDCYSFGVVLLEILTGLPVLDMSRENPDLKTFVYEYLEEDDEDDEAGDRSEPGTIYDLLDAKAGAWSRQLVDLLFDISNKCLDLSMKKRAKMKQVVKWLETGAVGK